MASPDFRVAGRTSLEIAGGQGTAEAGEYDAATVPDSLGGGPNRVLFEVGDCLTLIETNHSYLTAPGTGGIVSIVGLMCADADYVPIVSRVCVQVVMVNTGRACFRSVNKRIHKSCSPIGVL